MENLQMNFLHKEELKELFNCKETKLYHILKSGTLPLIKIGNEYMISEEDFMKWYKQNIGKEINFK